MSELILECRPKLKIVPLRTTEPQSRVGVIFDAKSGILEWPIGPEGDKGPQGAASRPWRIVGYVTDAADLPTGLTPDDAGKAWANTDTKAVHVWQGHRWHDPVPTGLSRPGDAGPPVRVDIGTVETLATGSNVSAAITGDAPDRILSVGLPRGAVGDKGPMSPASILRATDYVGPPPTRGQALVWSESLGGWVSARPGNVLGQWSITDAEFDATTVISGGGPWLVATIILSPLPVRYRLSCSGIIAVQHGARATGVALNFSTATIDVSMEYAGSGTTRVGLGKTTRYNTENTSYLAPISDRVIVLEKSDSKLTPASTSGIVPAGDAVTVKVTLGRNNNSDWSGGVRIVQGEGTNLQLTGLAV